MCLSLVLVVSVPLFGGQISSAKNNDKNLNATPTYNLYFGDLHSHTELSDGTGTPWEAFENGTVAGADFMALTEHVQFWHAYDAWVMKTDEWEELVAAADYYTTEDFVAIPAYETWMLANCGEVNVYNVPELPPVTNLGYRFDRLPNFYDWLIEQPGAIGQFNHPLYVSDNFMDFDYYNEARDVGMCIIEAYNGEYYDPSYTLALDAGWHVMPSSNSDTHAGDWIWNHEMRTVLLAESLTRAGLYDAMSACRGYATLDKNLRVEYTLNGAVMGSNLSNADGVYDAWIKIEDPDGTDADMITLVEIVTDGGDVIASFPTSGTSVEITATLGSDDARYFFVRVTTASPLNLEEPGITAWTAPVWTGR
jgi:hypothetical protein